jgi:hypothetical protein
MLINKQKKNIIFLRIIIFYFLYQNYYLLMIFLWHVLINNDQINLVIYNYQDLEYPFYVPVLYECFWEILMFGNFTFEIMRIYLMEIY